MAAAAGGETGNGARSEMSPDASTARVEPWYKDVRYVSAEKARQIAREETVKRPGMQYYWQKAATYVAGKQEAVIALDPDDEFEQWEEHYLEHLPRQAHMSLTLLMCKPDRNQAWWSMLTDGLD